MSRILAVGIATLDIINNVEHFPREDEELRALSQQIRRGGNAANSACILAQFGHQVSLLCTLARDTAGERIEKELRQCGVVLDQVVYVDNACTPTSYITLNRQNGSRTIIHYRDLPELKAEQFQTNQVERYDWFHFEGRNIAETEKMLRRLKRYISDQPISIEIEKPREGIERLFAYADILFFSRTYVTQHGYTSVTDFFTDIQSSTGPAILICGWGEQGAHACDHHGRHYRTPAFPPQRVVDTIGAGDTFNAGFIHAMLDGQTIESALISACKLAGRKVGQQGFANLVSNQ